MKMEKRQQNLNFLMKNPIHLKELVWTEWNECNENGPPSEKISISFKAEMIDQFCENGIWYDVIDKINLRPKFKNVIDKAPLLKI